MADVPCEEIVPGDWVTIEKLVTEPLEVTRAERDGQLVRLFGGTANVLTSFVDSTIQRLPAEPN